MRRLTAVLIALSAVSAAGAAPILKTQPEILANGAFKAKVLAGAEGVPAPTPQIRHYRIVCGNETKDVKWYGVRDLWRNRALVGEWHDKKGNVMRLAAVRSLAPEFEHRDWYREEIEKGLDRAEASFKGTDAELRAWLRLWDGSGKGRFFTLPKGGRYYVEFDFVGSEGESDYDRLLTAFVRSVSTLTKSGGNVSSMKWWTDENPDYRFLTDLDKAKGGKFIKDVRQTLRAMRKGYETYVPPQRKVGQCTVRVFKTREGYRGYRASTGVLDQWSSGLWDPNRDELLIAAEDPKAARSTMQHEGFHQYLAYATGRHDHAPWFNEGHAAFFENVKYNTANDTIKVTDEGNRAAWVARDPVLYANAISAVVRMDYDAFYSGDLNLNYCTAWALVYFLERGAYASKEFAPYRAVCPKYLELMKAGASWQEATAAAFGPVARRNIAADFLKFWKHDRKAALKVRR